MRFVAFLLLLVVVLIDMLALFGATRTITSFEAADLPNGGNRRLSAWAPSQPAWTSSSGQPVPPTVRRLWIALHVVFLSFSVLQILGWLTRSYDLPGPFGVPKKTTKGDEYETETATTGAKKFAGLSAPAKRGAAGTGASSYI